ncbi:hypothetical protein [Piscibacillus salipiscarius]|uniref:hypothetical protein n=1 Tax=Piscibacillus salipiscarius TaxID=299480 RepID=UPI00243689B1|nr:hypothetical protein [Piscibacillus salipiscarius]
MEILLFSLLGGLFICVMFSLRMLIEHETDQILNTVMDDYEPKPNLSLFQQQYLKSHHL